jgi:hypothetical protein
MLVQSERRMHSGVPKPQSSAAALLFAFFRASLLLFSFALLFPRCWFPLSTNENVEVPNEILKKNEESKWLTRFTFVLNNHSSRSQNAKPDSHLSSMATLWGVKTVWVFFFCFPCCDIATLAIILRKHLAKFGYRSHVSEKRRKI